MDWFDWADMATVISVILDRRRKGAMTEREKGRRKVGEKEGKREESRTERA